MRPLILLLLYANLRTMTKKKYTENQSIHLKIPWITPQYRRTNKNVLIKFIKYAMDNILVVAWLLTLVLQFEMCYLTYLGNLLISKN